MDHFFWDAIIFGFLLFDIAFIVFLIKKSWYAVATLCMFAFGIIFYGSFVEPRLVVVMQEVITINEPASSSKKIALLSDLHVGPYKGEGYLDKVIKKTLEQQPDIVLLGGDFIYKDTSELKALSKLSSLTAKFPVYAVMGNHDYDLYSATAPIDKELGEEVRQTLESAGIIVLTNTGIQIDSLYLAGIDDYWSRNVELDKSLAKRTAPTVPTILLSHNPDIILDILPEHGIDLVLSGHTHGGQIRLPKIGAIGKIPTQLGQAFDQKSFQEGSTELYITSGLGESGPRARLFNPPEIVLLDVRY